MIAFDTNILVYAAQARPDQRKARAIDLIAEGALGDALIPVQALAEFSAVCRSKKLLDLIACAQRIDEWSINFRTVAVVPSDILEAIASVERYQLSFYDALIIRTARRGGATILLSEDMADGATYDGVRTINPFDPRNAATVDLLFA